MNANNLTDLELTLGEVARAVEDGGQSVAYADRSCDAFHRMAARATFAYALYHAGQRNESEMAFREAEEIQKRRQTYHSLLYSGAGSRYCDLLLAAPERAAWQRCMESRLQAAGRGAGQSGSAGSDVLVVPSVPPARAGTPNEACRAVSQRAAQTLKWGMQVRIASLSDIARDHLSLGHAALCQAILEPSHPSEFEEARRELDAAVIDLRRASTQHELPRGFLTRAWLRFLTGARTGPESAQVDLDEAWEIAERGPMRLHMADIHLYRARLYFREKQYPWESPVADLVAAEKLINECRYHRRDEELADAKRAILGT